MSEIDLLQVARGTITAPAGCGKTQLIADSLKRHASSKPVLVLTHTNAGKGALEVRLAKAGVPRSAYRVSTIDSWAIRLITKFPARSAYRPDILRLENPHADYPAIREAAWRLLSQQDISQALNATYSRLLVDEYQDCTLPQHHIVDWIATVLPTCVLGDPLQAIFGFKEPTVDWQKDVHVRFPPCGELDVPWRWKNVGAERLGQWLLECRIPLLAGAPIDLNHAPPEVIWVPLPADADQEHAARLVAARAKTPVAGGSVLVIGDSMKPQGQRLVASQTPGATTVEAVDLRDLTAFGRSFDPTDASALRDLVTFAGELMTNLGVAELLRRIDSLTRGTARKDASPAEAAAIAFQLVPSFSTAIAALEAFADGPEVRVFRPEVLHVCKAAMREATSGAWTFHEAVVRVRERNRHLGRSVAKRAVGSTLLLKGLEADVVVVLNPIVMDSKHLYVALTRGARQVVVCSSTPVLQPVRRKNH